MSRDPDDNIDSMTTVHGGHGQKSESVRSDAIAAFAQGRYVVVGLLGEGGQKRVFLTHDTQLDRHVVIAVLKTGRLDDKAMSRLRVEARALARLGDHPHIVTVHDMGEEDGQPYIVTQFVDGGPLNALQQASAQRLLPLSDVLRIGREVCEALHHAHQHGIVHRDLKPGNIWLTKEGSIKLGDFGLASGLELSRVTTDGALMGTVAYMAPEQALGGDVGPRTDLYSLGVVLYELVTGRRPFVGDRWAAVLSQHLYATPVAPSVHNVDVPAALDALILQLLAKAPQDRPASAQEVGETLSGIALDATANLVAAAPKPIRPLDRLAGSVFVGRDKEIDELRAAMEDARAGSGSIVPLIGEPGSGKTSIAEQVLTYARLRGAAILRSHCYEGEGAPAYWPWVQLLRNYAADHTADHLLAMMGDAAADVAELDTEIRKRLPDLKPGLPLDAEQARFRLFDGVTTFLRNVSQIQPLVIFVDDLHWADAASLRLLQFLAREIRQTHILLIATLRPDPFGPQHPLTQTLGLLASQGLNRRITLQGLTEEDVARFIELTMGTAPPPRLVSAVYHRTEGNPFFVKEVVRLLAADEQLDGADDNRTWSIKLPQSVRDVIMRRLGHLSQECIRILTIASIIGRDFDVDTVGRVGDIEGDRLLDMLEEALAARLVTESDRQTGACRFSHALIRETLYESVGANRRSRLHLSIGTALEEAHPDKKDSQLAALAHHFFEAIRLGQAEKAIHYAVLAGQRADGLLAYEEAASQYEMALRALEFTKSADPDRRCSLLLKLGEAQTKAGASAQARDSFLRAAELARACGARETFAHAVLGLGAGTAVGTKLGHAVDHVEIDHLKEALAGIGDVESELRVRLLAQLALALYHEPAERAALSQQAVEMGRRVSDPRALLAALYSRCVALEGFPSAEERLALAREIVRTAHGVGDTGNALRGHYRCFRELVELCDLPGAERELERYTGVAEKVRQPRYQWYVPYGKASLAAFRGEFASAESLAREALSLGQRAQDPNAALFCTIITYTCWLHLGAFSEIEQMLKRFVATYPSTSRAWRVQLVRLYCLMDRLDDARAAFEGLTREDLEDLTVDGSLVSTLAVLPVICWYLNDTRRAERLYPRLLPFAKFNVVAGNSANGGGAASLALATTAATLARWEEAESFFEDAIEKNTRMGAKPWLVHTYCSYVQMLQVRRHPGDEAHASALLQQAIALARDLGMKKATQWIESQVPQES